MGNTVFNKYILLLFTLDKRLTEGGRRRQRYYLRGFITVLGKMVGWRWRGNVERSKSYLGNMDKRALEHLKLVEEEQTLDEVTS
jgi:hypothetical protein